MKPLLFYQNMVKALYKSNPKAFTVLVDTSPPGTMQFFYNLVPFTPGISFPDQSFTGMVYKMIDDIVAGVCDPNILCDLEKAAQGLSIYEHHPFHSYHETFKKCKGRYVVGNKKAVIAYLIFEHLDKFNQFHGPESREIALKQFYGMFPHYFEEYTLKDFVLAFNGEYISDQSFIINIKN